MIHVVELDYPLDHKAQTLLQIGPNFVQPVDNDVPTDEELQMIDSDIESMEEDDEDPDLVEEAYSPDISDDIDEY